MPEVRLLMAGDVVALWEAMTDTPGGAGTEPPFWAAAWPGGQALARLVLDRPSLVSGRRVLDVGAGSGLVAIAATLAGAAVVEASEIDPFGVAVIPLNAEANGIAPPRIVGDLLGSGASGGVPSGGGASGGLPFAGEPPADVVLAGDVCYDRAMTGRVLPFLVAARAAGADVLLGDPGRPYLPRDGLIAVTSYDVPETDGEGTRATTVWRFR